MLGPARCRVSKTSRGSFSSSARRAAGRRRCLVGSRRTRRSCSHSSRSRISSPYTIFAASAIENSGAASSMITSIISSASPSRRKPSAPTARSPTSMRPSSSSQPSSSGPIRASSLACVIRSRFCPRLHKRLIVTGDENIRRFEDAWAAIPDRAAGRRIPWSTIEPRWLRYDEGARYGSYVERLFAAVGKERCLVMVFDDLVADPGRTAPAPARVRGPRNPPRPRKEGRAREQRRALHRAPAAAQASAASAPALPRQREAPRPLRQGGRKEGRRDGAPSLRKRILSWNRIEDEKSANPAARSARDQAPSSRERSTSSAS